MIPVSQYVWYTVEAREQTGADQGVPGNAVVIHQVDEARRFSSPYDRIAQVVDPDGNGNPNDAGAMWTVGETFTDASLDLTVSVDSLAGDGSYQVSVAYGAPDAVAPTNPTSFASSSHTVGQWSGDDTIRIDLLGSRRRRFGGARVLRRVGWCRRERRCDRGSRRGRCVVHERAAA